MLLYSHFGRDLWKLPQTKKGTQECCQICCYYSLLLFCFDFFLFSWIFFGLFMVSRFSQRGEQNKCATPFLSIDSPVWLFQIRINFIYCNHHCRSDMATMESRVNTSSSSSSAKVRTSTKNCHRMGRWVYRGARREWRVSIIVCGCVYFVRLLARSRQGHPIQPQQRRQQCMPRHWLSWLRWPTLPTSQGSSKLQAGT